MIPDEPERPGAHPLRPLAEEFLEHVRDHRVEPARRSLAHTPALAGVDIFTASAAGDLAVVRGLLASDPALALAEHGTHRWNALLYASASPLPVESIAVEHVARALLAAGADANSSHPWSHDELPISALYHACVTGRVGVARALLEHGARTQDGESIYHAAEHHQVACLEALLEFGADLSAAQSPYGNTPLYFLAGYSRGDGPTPPAHLGMRWLLEHGADPNVPSGPHRETPLHQVARMGGGVEIARALLEHGADPNAARDDGRTPYVMALRRGHVAMCDAMRAHGARATPSVVDEFVAAAARGDEASARACLAADPGLVARLDREDHALIPQLIAEGRLEHIPLLVALGFDLAWEGAWEGTPLHHAAWRGLPGLVTRLIELGAPLDRRDRTHGSSPLGWAAHGSRWCRDDDASYLAIVEALLVAGARRAPSLNRFGEPPEALASARVAAFLERWYREHPDTA